MPALAPFDEIIFYDIAQIFFFFYKYNTEENAPIHSI